PEMVTIQNSEHNKMKNKEVARLTAEVEQFREALEEIRIEGEEYMDGPRENDASMGEIIEIARTALEKR
ncbi:hypothetical protein LCGC14_2409060, partial [marine sediment metagenome]